MINEIQSIFIAERLERGFVEEGCPVLSANG